MLPREGVLIVVAVTGRGWSSSVAADGWMDKRDGSKEDEVEGGRGNRGAATPAGTFIETKAERELGRLKLVAGRGGAW